MTAKEYYLKTSDMAYQVPVATSISANDIIVGKIGMTAKGRDGAKKLMEDNSFYAVDYNTDDVDLENVSLVLEFHYGIDDWDAYLLDVCDVIDCRPSGGKLVLSCRDGKYELIKEVHPPKEEPTAQCDDEDDGETEKDGKDGKVSLYDAFDEFFRGFKFPSFGVFGGVDLSKTVDATKKVLMELTDAVKGDKDSRFYDFSCRIDPDGKVYVKRSTNDGTVTKTFSLKGADSEEKKDADGALSDLRKELYNDRK